MSTVLAPSLTKNANCPELLFSPENKASEVIHILILANIKYENPDEILTLSCRELGNNDQRLYQDQDHAPDSFYIVMTKNINYLGSGVTGPGEA